MATELLNEKLRLSGSLTTSQHIYSTEIKIKSFPMTKITQLLSKKKLLRKES